MEQAYMLLSGMVWGCSSAGRAPRSQRGGQRFDPAQLHHRFPNTTTYFRGKALTEGRDGSARLKFPSLLGKFWVAIVALSLFSALYSFVMIDVVHAGYPYNIAYFYPHTKQLFHWDFTVFVDRFVYFRQPEFWDDTRFYPFTYPAATAVVFAALYKLPHAVWWYVGLCLIALAIGCWKLAAEMAQRGVARGLVA